MNTLA